MDPASGALWAAFGAIVIANVLLSGDNAVVIALAARSLPDEQQRKAIFWGSVAAIVLRIALTLVALQLLRVPFLKLTGAAALLWLGAKLMADSHGPDVPARATLWAAVRTILVADAVMSVDNVIAVAGAAGAAPPEYRLGLLAAGLAMSIPLIIAGSTLLIKVMERFPIIIALGAALLGYLAGQMLVTDPATEAWFEARVPQAELVFGAGGAVLIVAIGQWLRRRGRPKAP